MFLIFDVDGTLVDGERTDWPCFEQAILEVTGRLFSTGEHLGDSEVTAPALIERFLDRYQYSSFAWRVIEERIRSSYVKNLREAFKKDASCFRPFPGVLRLLKELAGMPGVTLAIASGDWGEAIEYKLACAGIQYEGIAIATASDASKRTDIIRKAAERAGRPLTQATYIGNGRWDFVAAQRLGIDFIGVGHEREQLRDAGAEQILDDLHLETLFERFRDQKAA